MKVSLIAAMSKDRVIGKGGKIPWHLSADLEHFKELTMNHPVIMGRKTFESFGSKALPGRTNIILTRNAEYDPSGAVTVPSLSEALDLTQGEGEIFLIGGQSLYEEGLKMADTIYLTLVETEITDGDVFFPKINDREWRLANSESHRKDEKNPFDYTFLIYERKKKSEIH